MGRPGRRRRARARSVTPLALAAGLLVGVLPLLPASPAAAIAGTTTSTNAGTTAGTTASGTSGSAGATTPLRIELDDIEPGEMPRAGRIEVTGTITNADDVPWSTIQVSSFLDDDPIDDVAELEQASRVDEELPVGERILEPGTFDEIDLLEPGASTSFRVRVPSRLLLEQVSDAGSEPEPGVYWFGIHALGESPQGRDNLTDGRARTFLPLLPEQVDQPVPVSLVVPLRAPVDYAADGTVDDVEAWVDRLSPGGRLRDRLDFGAAADQPISWLVDPAVLDAVTQLANGNPARSLAPTDDAGPDGTDDSGGPSDTPSPGASDAPDDPAEQDGQDGQDGDTSPEAAPVDPADPADEASAVPTEDPDGSAAPTPPDSGLDPAQVEAAERALTWLDSFSSEVAGDEVLALPYGDIDVAGALSGAPGLYRDARDQGSAALRALTSASAGPAVPVVAPPSGYLDPAVLDELDELDDSSLLVGSDAMLDGVAPSLAVVDGRDVVLASTGASSGGPGPTDPLGPVALRQRILSEAALRLLSTPSTTTGTDDLAIAAADAGQGGVQGPALRPYVAAGDPPEPLVVVLPRRWDASDGTTFFDGLGSAGIDLGPVAGPGGATSQDGLTISRASLAYPAREARSLLDQDVFDAVIALRRHGETLQNLLTRNSRIASIIDAEALTAASYAHRSDPDGAQDRLDASRGWVEDRLAAVTIDAPPGVTLSGASGSFSVTVANNLDEPVSVRVRPGPVADGGITVAQPDRVDLGPQARSTVLVEAADAAPGVHSVPLRIVDPSGRPLPALDIVPIRSAQVSAVIWGILGTGVGLLFIAIALRAVRRIRDHRRGPRVAS